LTSGFILAGKGKKPDKEPPPPADPAIAYRSTKGKDKGLAVMNADGSNQAVIYQSETGNPTWAPDGSALAFLEQQEDYTYDLWRIDVSVVDGEPQGSNPTELLQDLGYHKFRWSPQGDVIGFARGLDGESVIQTVPATGGEVETIYTAPEGFGVGDITWNSDGSKLAFRSESNGLASILVLDISEGSTTTVYGPTTDWFAGLDWARTKDTLAFTCNPPAGNICTLDMTDPSATPVTVIGESSKLSSWSPDDSQIVFCKWEKKNGWNNIMVYTLSTGEMEKLADGFGPDWGRHVSG
jgi:Tol biopolymer transport system component